jgi:DNA modification methylase
VVKPYYEDAAAGIVIYNADCREILPSLPKVDLVLTDPPYGMNKAEWDKRIVPVDSWLPVARSLAPTALFSGIKGMYDYPRPDWVMAWVRLGSVQRNGALRGFNNWEPILTYGLISLPNDTVCIPNFPDVEGHPTPKPLRLIRAVLSRLPRGTVLDPFMGSGTTLRAAKDLGRKAIGIEIEERYCEIAAKRMAQEVLEFA